MKNMNSIGDERLKLLKDVVHVRFYLPTLSRHIDITKKQARKIIKADINLRFNFDYSTPGWLFIDNFNDYKCF